MKIRFLLIVVLLSIFQLQTQAQKSEINITPTLENLYKVDDGIYRSNQPTALQFKSLEMNGIKEVLNLRRFHSDTDDAKNTNLTLHHIKVRASQVNDNHLLEAMRIIRDRKGDILVHCHHGSDRTGVVIATYRIIFQDWSKEDAIAEMKKEEFGFHSIFSNLPKLIQNLDIENFKKELGLPN